MDTQFWGPSGWHLLHILASAPVKYPSAVKEWVELLEYVLPCKYCRASFHDYMKQSPLTLEIIHTQRFGQWMYDIHNRVNAKLRSQGLIKTSDPSWNSIHKRYANIQCNSGPLVGWDFMTSVAYSTPSADYIPIPMPDAPKRVTDIPIKNRYNLLTRQERLAKLRRWWDLIPSILPCESWRRAWASASDSVSEVPLTKGREAVMRWMWRIEEAVCSGLQ